MTCQNSTPIEIFFQRTKQKRKKTNFQVFKKVADNFVSHKRSGEKIPFRQSFVANSQSFQFFCKGKTQREEGLEERERGRGEGGGELQGVKRFRNKDKRLASPELSIGWMTVHLNWQGLQKVLMENRTVTVVLNQQ